MVPLGEIAGCVVGLLVVAFVCLSIVTKERKRRARLDHEGDQNAMRMGNYVEPREPVIRVRPEKPEP